MVVITAQSTHMSNHPIMHRKYVQFNLSIIPQKFRMEKMKEEPSYKTVTKFENLWVPSPPCLS